MASTVNRDDANDPALTGRLQKKKTQRDRSPDDKGTKSSDSIKLSDRGKNAQRNANDTGKKSRTTVESVKKSPAQTRK